MPFRALPIVAAVTVATTVAAARFPAPLAAQPDAFPRVTADPVVPPSAFGDLHARSIGPFRGGRVTTVSGVRQEKRTFWMGSTGGGVWKTTDAGATWRNVSDGWFETASIGAVRVAPSDPDVVWVGTGSDGLRSNVITGRGVYRTTDGGDSWRFLGLRDVGQIGAVEVHPSDPNTAFVAAIGRPFAASGERGVYRTTDGGATWDHVLFITDSTGVVDLELKPDEPRTLYAAAWRGQRKPWTIISGAMDEGGVYKSTDGGDTWTKLGGGLPTGLIGKIDLAVSAAAPERVYALVEAPAPAGGLYRSDDAGATWTQTSDNGGLVRRPFYYTNVDADPSDAERVYVANETFFASTDGGRTFRPLRTPHGDNHDLWIHPDDPDVWIESNDGGANVTLDGGRTWSTQYNQPTAELYQVAVDDRWPYRVYGAQQDNSTLIVPSRAEFRGRPDDPSQYWMQGPGCETGPVVPSPWNADVVYGACKGKFSRLHLGTGQEINSWVGGQYLYGFDPKDMRYRFQRVAPIELSPHAPGVIYHGSQFVHRSRDDGMTWETISPDLTAFTPETQGASGEPITRDVTGEEYYSTLYAIRESPLAPGVIWAGANDGPIHVTRDGGRTWIDVTPPDLPPGGRVQALEPSHHAAGTAYAAVYRYLLGDWAPYLYRTTDYGATWTRLTTGTNGIPDDTPVRVVREDPTRAGLLYVGTEFGLYVSFDDGAHFQSLQLDLPVTPVTDIAVHREDIVLSTMGRGFWIIDDVAPLRQLAAGVPEGGSHLFAPSVAIRWRSGTSGASPTTPEYPGARALIDWWFAEAPTGPVTLTIHDATGALVRGFSSEAAGETTRVTQGMRAPELVTSGTPRVPAQAGHTRFAWDLRHAGPWHANPLRAGRGGPMVAPGTYTVRLAADGVVHERPLVVRADPRLRSDGITDDVLVAQVAHNLAVRDALSDARRTSHELSRALADAGDDAARRARLEALRQRLETAPVRYSQPMLVDQLGYLAGMTTGADQRVPRDAATRLAELREELAAIVRALDGLGVRVADDAAASAMR